MALRVSLTLRVVLAALILFYQTELGRPQPSLFGGGGECNVDACMAEYNDLADELSPEHCSILQDTIDCLNEGDCATDFSAIILKESVRDDQKEYCDACDADTCLDAYFQVQLLEDVSKDLLCPLIEEALNCLDQDICAGDTNAILLRENVQDSYNRDCCEDQNCSTPASTPATPTTPACPPPDSIPDSLPCNSSLEDCCPRLPSTTCDPVRSVEPATVLSSQTDEILQHCSVFSYSHVRPWGAYGPRIDTCSLPGSWFLVKHPSFSIEIEASADSANSPYTKLDKVNLTFHDPLLTYVAEGSKPLPSTFSEVWDLNFPAFVIANGDVATIVSTSLGVTVIVRRYANHLSVTVQVPGRMILETHGLCNGGCPHHAYRNITEFIDNSSKECPSDHGTSTFECFTYIGNGRTFGISNSSYTQVCQFDVLLERNLRMVTVINATVRDALLLPDVGSPPSPFEEEPTVITVDPDDFITPETTATDTPPSTEGTVGTFSSARPLSSLHTAPLLLITLLSIFLSQR